MDHGPDVADCQTERVAYSHDDLQDRIARISDMDPTLLSHDLFRDNDSSTSNLIRRSIIEQPIIGADTTRSGSVSQARRESDDCTDHEMSSIRLLETRDRDELSQPPSEVEYGQHDSTAPWLPFYLRRTTSLLFLAVFAIMIVILETLFTLSLRNSGLSAGTTSMRYLWSYGTTGTLTLAAAFWHRLDYEEKVAAPWFKANPITSSKAALLVDYIDAWSLLVPFRALRNRDYKVACSSTVSLLLQLVTVLSTALFVLSSTNFVNDAEPIWLTSRFVDDPKRLINGDSLLPYYIAMRSALPNSITGLNASVNPNSAYTEGYTDHFAYGTFNPVSSELLEVKAVVEGLSMDLTCEPASVEENVVMPRFLYLSATTVYLDKGAPNFDINYQGCQTSIDWPGFMSQYLKDLWYPQNNMTVRERGMVLRHVPGFSRDHCHSEDNDSHRLVLLSGEIEWRLTNRSIVEHDGQQGVAVNIDAKVTRAVVLVCTPSLNQELLEISRNSGGVPKVSRRSGQTADFLKNIVPWDLIDYVLNSRVEFVLPSNEAKVGNTTVLGDDFSQLLLDFCDQSCQEPPDLLNSTFLERILASFLSSHVAATAHVLLRETTHSPSIATSITTRERLWVQAIVCQAMVGVLSTVIFLVLAMQFEPKKSLARNICLGSIAATMVLSGNVACSQLTEGLGNASTEELAKWLNGSLQSKDSTSSPNSCSSAREEIARDREGSKIMERATASSGAGFSDPIPLRPVSRITLYVAIAGCSITLASLFRKSVDEQGLREDVESKYQLYAWTIIPASILTVVSWWLSSIDIQARTVSPYDSLKRKKFGVDILHLNLLRGLVPTVLYWEVKTSDFAAALTTIAALLGATLTTASAAMFHVSIYPLSGTVALSPSTVLTTILPDGLGFSTAGRMSSLILEANLSYSQQVYEDLVFPTFSMTSTETENSSYTTNTSSTIISITAPALRPRLSCRMYSQPDITAIFEPNYTLFGNNNPKSGIVVNITTEECIEDIGGYGTAFFDIGGRSESLFGTATTSQREIIAPGSCSELLYIWGSYKSSPRPVTNISAVACNSSVELVYAVISLFGEDMSLDLSQAPKAIESTAKYIQEYEPSNDLQYGLYMNLASLLTAGTPLFDPFFQQLVTSRYAIPISAIGDPTQSQVVMDAILFQHRIIHAQFLSASYRMDINSSYLAENPTNGLMSSLFFNETSGEQIKLPASLTYPFGQHRVVQDPTATAILEVLLLSILILSILGWWLHPTEAALPWSPTSVASVLALLVGGNLLEHIYDGSPEPLCWEDFESRLGKDSRFYLGWDPSTSGKSSSQRRFGIWLINERNQESSS